MTTFEIVLAATEITDELERQVLAAGLDHGLLSATGGVVSLQFEIDGGPEDIAEAARPVLLALRRHGVEIAAATSGPSAVS